MVNTEDIMGGGGQSDLQRRNFLNLLERIRCDSVLEIDFKSTEISTKTTRLKRVLGGIIEI